MPTATTNNLAGAETLARTSAEELSVSLAALDTTLTDLAISTDEDYALYGETLVDVKSRANAIKKKQDEIVEPLRDAKRDIDASMKAVTALFAPLFERVDRIAGRISAALTDYRTRKEREAQQERDRLALVAAQETQRLRSEAQAQADAMAATGDAQGAAMLQATAQHLVVPPPVVATAPPKVAGLATRVRWVGEVYDLAALVTGVASGEVPLAVLSVNQSALNDAADGAKGELAWPGVRTTKKTLNYSTGR